ncbi:MAG TPA: ABC transporter permease, partial [Trueperaceae bacterium]|nr:ABC transporter permease [Trueperaceae bacterium]
VLGGLIASLGFFFLPLIELKPNRIASGVSFFLLQLEGDQRFLVLFALAVLPLFVALRADTEVRGWLLAGIGNALLLLTLLLPAVEGGRLLTDAASLLGEGDIIRNPRILPSAAVALGLVGGYVVLFAGVRDLLNAGVSRVARLVASWGGALLIAVLFAFGAFDVYSVVVEFQARGELLGRAVLEHTLLVAVSLAIGFMLGIGLGLWASRDERVAPVLLYAVGIIQTVPSLALFGVLLVPLAWLGSSRAGGVGLVFVTVLAAAVVLLLLYRRFAAALGGRARQAVVLLCAVVTAVPLALLVVVLSSFLFRVSFVAFGSSGQPFATLRTLMLVFLLAGLALWFVQRSMRSRRARRLLMYLSRAGYLAFAAVLLIALFQGGQRYLANVDSLASLTMRNLGVSGIGVAPAVIALTLYSLLPLVRNTYAGLKNVDNAIIDSGRGMGMTASQRFFQIELPIAMPVIMAGVRNAGVALIGIAAVASVIGAGGLGDFIFNGINNTSIDQILLGTIPAVLLAVLLDAGLQAIERLLSSPGIRHL